MPLCQYRITPSNNGQRFTVPVSGKANIKVLSLQYYDNNNNHHIPIRIKSDTLIFPYSSSPYLQALVGVRVFNAQFDTGKNEYSINGCDLHGAMTLEVVDQDTGAQPAHFGGCLLTLDIEQINVGF
jgi:hypothetical protein